MSILARMGLIKLRETGQAISEGIINLDPNTASKAQIDELDDQLKGLSLQLAESEQVLEKEQAEADAAQSNFDHKKAAAKILQQQTENEADPAKKAGLEKSLDKLIGQLEELKADVDREKQEADDARALRDELKETTEMMSTKLKQARGSLDQAKRRVERAKLQEASAEKSAELAAQLVGIKESGSKFNSVLTALDKAAAKHEAAAAAAKTRADLLKPATSNDDENIAAALREAGGEPPKTDRAARLAALE